MGELVGQSVGLVIERLPLWTDPGLQSGISLRQLISTLKKSAGGERIVGHTPKILAREEKATTTTVR